jgi:hypothetical protein
VAATSTVVSRTSLLRTWCCAHGQRRSSGLPRVLSWQSSQTAVRAETILRPVDETKIFCPVCSQESRRKWNCSGGERERANERERERHTHTNKERGIVVYTEKSAEAVAARVPLPSNATPHTDPCTQREKSKEGERQTERGVGYVRV